MKHIITLWLTEIIRTLKKKYNNEKETTLSRFKIKYNKNRDIKSVQI
jgi:hypothetical protein